ncbi:phage recombination protein Bet [uncultured Amaricoccus sp.]|uniref:phage recombination protein Bet n=1 Tax=uncultured Amaricoccus sp. TaxID=339341 RepID=UPI0026294325|nr:phage recombination protein Bet [uncultured Amaricoccus sp.]
MATAIQISGFTGAQLALIRNTVAADCNEQEFNLFFEAARAYGLDPFRKQISAIVFNKKAKDQSKRRMAIIVSRDGYRVIAQRCKNYRPASEPAQIEIDPSLVSPTNPKGIVKATVRLWQQDNRGEWFPVIGEAYWDEFAAVKDEFAANENQEWRPTGKQTLDGNWGRMPIVMITKCAEAQALRAGWPDQFGGIYAEEEMHRAEADLTASEAVAQEAENARVARIGGRGISFAFDHTGVLESVPVGAIADRCMAFIRDNDAEAVYRWSVQNRASLAQFWTAAPADALEVKKATEAKTAPMTRGAA